MHSGYRAAVPGHVLSMVKEENAYASIMQPLPGPQLRSIDQHTGQTPRQQCTAELGWEVSHWVVMLYSVSLNGFELWSAG